MEESIYLGSAYLAPVQYYTKLYAYPHIYVEQYDNYIKQTYRNRCIIASADGPLALTIPTEKTDSLKCLMKDIRISEHGKWRHLHWTAIESAYKNSPYFDYYQDDLRPFYEKRYDFLYDFNEQLCRTICELIDLHPEIQRTKDYKQEFSTDEYDFREMIHPKKNYSSDTGFYAHPYYQVFETRHNFLPNLSIIDLLFNMGPESLLILRDSITIVSPLPHPSNATNHIK